jgi:hypothetical protein
MHVPHQSQNRKDLSMRQIALLSLFIVLLWSTLTTRVNAQTQPRTTGETTPSSNESEEKARGSNVLDHSALETIERKLNEQREEIETLRALVKEQSRLMSDLKERVERAEQQTALLIDGERTNRAGLKIVSYEASKPAVVENESPSAQQLEDRVKAVETQSQKASETIAKQLGSITFSGDIRFRYESLYGQQNSLSSSAAPGLLGNALSSRQRLRLRARFAARGTIGKEFEWGLRFATGNYSDLISANQTLTDFFSHKTFALDNAYITWKPAKFSGLVVQAGKFETPWIRTEMTWDNDNNPEGVTESYTRTFKSSKVKSVAITAWQLPLLERNAAFILGSDGQVDLSQSRRIGRDLALYGAQLRTQLEPSKNLAISLSAADLYFHGTQFITPVQFFGLNIQFPVIVTIPASGSTPAQIVTTQVSIPRELFVGGSNLGIGLGTNNATNRDGRLSSGFNLVDLIARVDFTRSEQWPIVFLFNYVRNTQVRDVVAAGPDGADLVLPNHEDDGYWAEFRIGKTQKRGDMSLGYTFMRIEKDAVLTPFNFSDVTIQSDVRAHRFNAAYAADPRVVLSFTGIFSTRPNGLLGPFIPTPRGSLNRTLTRLQFDTTFRF